MIDVNNTLLLLLLLLLLLYRAYTAFSACTVTNHSGEFFPLVSVFGYLLGKLLGYVFFRDQSLLMPGRGPEDILIGTNKISWPLIFPSEIFNDPPFYSCGFSCPHSPFKVPQVRTLM